MSLKAFHIVFIVISTLFVLGFGAWALLQYREEGGLVNLLYSIGAGLSGAGLIIYGRYFLKKLKDIGYL